ncbi:MAG: NAD(P)-dependent alcohol dehydrogenase [Candidatus Aminicenantes bacterium]|nr:NAD(P)-dependent alcohol dehydrogenase [Candidatus Aminicenantes bacterium]
MRSIIYNKYGGPEVLEVADVEKPEPDANSILVRVKASSVNPVDYKVRRGDMKIMSGKKFPKDAGSDFAGVIEKAGEAVAGYKKGDEVYGFLNPMKGGTYSDYLIADPANVSLKPERFSFEQAASMPIAALTALQALNYLGNVNEGTTVLINGATGGVGSFAVQLAKTLGAEVTGICSENNMKLCKDLGADEVFNYAEEELNKSGRKFDVFFDAAAKSTFSKSKKFINSRGIYITTIPGIGVIINRIFNFLPFKKKSKFIMVKSSGIDLAILTGFAMTDTMEPVIAKSFKLEDVADAQELAESGKFRGKIVIKID